MPTDDNYSDFYGNVSIMVADIIKIAQCLLRPLLLPNCFPLRDSNPMHLLQKIKFSYNKLCVTDFLEIYAYQIIPRRPNM